MIHQITLKPSSIARVLGTAASFLVVASIGGQLAAHLTGDRHLYGLVFLFNVNAEKNIPSGFSTLLLFFAALLLAIIALLEGRQLRSPVHWAILSIGFAFMAADEALSFHERLIKPMRMQLGGDTYGVFYFAWVIPYIAIVLLLAPFFLGFMSRLPVKTRRAFLLAAALYLGGVIGVELVEGRFAESYGRHNPTYAMFVTVEESLEMAGAIVFVWALLTFIADRYEVVRFRFEKGR